MKRKQGRKNMHLIGKIDKELYHCVSKNIVTDKVVITDNQIEHINTKHSYDYDSYSKYFQEILTKPDYILEGNKPDTALILKEIEQVGCFQMILRLRTPEDPKEYMNSIITFFKIDEKRWNRYIRTKKILYKKGSIG